MNQSRDLDEVYNQFFRHGAKVCCGSRECSLTQTLRVISQTLTLRRSELRPEGQQVTGIPLVQY